MEVKTAATSLSFRLDAAVSCPSKMQWGSEGDEVSAWSVTSDGEAVEADLG
jgi:hypothetical protein